MGNFILNRNTKIRRDKLERLNRTAPVDHAVAWFERDMEHVLEQTSDLPESIISLTCKTMQPEQYQIDVTEKLIRIQAGDELGFVYALLHISKQYLGIQPFWFWNDQEFMTTAKIEIPEGTQVSQKKRVRFRGWFLNDEVLISHWDAGVDASYPWEMAMEALLRLGGNMVIPGTDRNAGIYDRLAFDLGLWVTHHHSQPLGAEMFAREYPELEPSFRKYPDLFRKLWKEGIERQKGQKVVWGIGFRGQGDMSFWENEPSYDTLQKRGETISRLLQEQYDMVKEADENAVCCTNLYGEITELYQRGMLKIPEDVILIWADNGYGKMVSRRQDNNNPRTYALPKHGMQGLHGIYYHVSFYDLQAANHITMLGNSPEFVRRELTEVLETGADSYWIVNCSNVKPHVTFLDMIAHMWNEGTVDVEKNRKEYVLAYYGREQSGRVEECLKRYHTCAPLYGTHEDEHAGEQFTNHVTRILISQYMKDASRPAEELLWAVEKDTLRGQLQWYESVCAESRERYQDYAAECARTAELLTGHAKTLFEDSVLLQANIHKYCFDGAYLACRAISEALDGAYQKAFYHAGKAAKQYLSADRAMRDREHGKWHGFYENECLTDIKQTAWLLKGFMMCMRNLGDGPHFYQWQRDFSYSKEDRQVKLLLIKENYIENEELFSLMEKAWG